MKWTSKLICSLQGESAARAYFLIYAILLLPIYCLPVCTPDEAWFEHDAMMFNDASCGLNFFQVIFGQQNHLGYGASYWISYGLLAKLTTHPLVLMRVVSFFANLTIPYLLLRECRDALRRPSAILAMLLWFSFTAAWWVGKVTGPELLSLALVFGGLHALSKATRFSWVALAGLLIGAGVGIKSNAAPAALCLVFILPHTSRPWRSLLVVGLGFACGFVAANPFVLHDPATLLANIRRHDKFGAGYTTHHFAEIMWNTQWEWEGVFRGGYFNWGISPLAVPLYLWLLWRCKLPWAWFVGGFTCTCAGVLLYLTSRSYQGWYWLPLLSLFPLTVLQIRKLDTASWRVALALLLINLVCNAPWIGMQYYSKVEQFAYRFEKQKVLVEAQKIASAPRDGLLVTILDQGIELERDRPGADSKKAEIVSDLAGFFLLNELRFGRRELSPGETWVVIHDLRLRKFNPIVEPARDAIRLGPEYEITQQQGEYVTSLRIHRKSLAAKKPQKRG